MEMQRFSEALGQTVLIQTTEQGIKAVIQSVDSCKQPSLVTHQSFSVLLAAEQEPVLEQGIYPLVFPDGEVLDLFLVPLGAEGERMVYEIVFN